MMGMSGIQKGVLPPVPDDCNTPLCAACYSRKNRKSAGRKHRRFSYVAYYSIPCFKSQPLITSLLINHKIPIKYILFSAKRRNQIHRNQTRGNHLLLTAFQRPAWDTNCSFSQSTPLAIPSASNSRRIFSFSSSGVASYPYGSGHTQTPSLGFSSPSASVFPSGNAFPDSCP